MNQFNSEFRQIWVVDFEFIANPGDRQIPVCIVLKEIISGQVKRVWLGDNPQPHPPYSTGPDALLVAYYASAELNCHLSLNWPLPERILDLYAEFRNHTNGLATVSGSGLLGALAHYRLNSITSEDKNTMRDLVLRGGPWTKSEQLQILDYCQSDVEVTEQLFRVMAKDIDLPRALLRGRYMKAVARMEWNGVPLDMQTLEILRSQWDGIKCELVAAVDERYQVYEGLTFKQNRFKEFLARNGIEWPQLTTGNLNLQDETFQEMAKMHPILQPLRELRHSMGQLRLNSLSMGEDGRNRCLLSPFSSKTGRNQPSNAKFIFGPATWLRFLIKPGPGQALAYIDWSQQEFGIAAALSGDKAMQEAYLSGDPYLAFAKRAGGVPEEATKDSHAAERENYKACVLAVQYGMGKQGLARRINQSTAKAQNLLQAHKEAYPDFWRWIEGAVDYGILRGRLWTTFGWEVQVGAESNPRMLQNYPMQANGAEMLRIACILATEEGIKVCAPVHDAILIEAPASEIDEVVARTQEIMAKASEIVLNGFRLRTDAKITRYPERYHDERGEEMWEKLQGILSRLQERDR